MHPSKVDRAKLKQLIDLPNIGKACAQDLELLGINEPRQLIGRCPWQMFAELERITSKQHDPCMLDVFISITRFMAGEEAQPWWYYTAERKQIMQHKVY